MSHDYLNNEARGGNRVSRMLHAQQLEEAGNGDYDAEENQYLRLRSFHDEAPELADERTNSMGSRYTRNFLGNWVQRPNEMMKWIEDNPGPMPTHRLGLGRVGADETRRSDKVFGQYLSTFGERSQAAGGGVLGFMKSHFGRGMKRANQARYGS